MGRGLYLLVTGCKRVMRNGGGLRGGVSRDPLSVFPIAVGDLGLGNQIHGDPQVPGIRGGDLGSTPSCLPATPVQQVSKGGFGCCLGMFANPVSAPVGREDGMGE